jgi:hypothetical protein
MLGRAQDRVTRRDRLNGGDLGTFRGRDDESITDPKRFVESNPNPREKIGERGLSCENDAENTS